MYVSCDAELGRLGEQKINPAKAEGNEGGQSQRKKPGLINITKTGERGWRTRQEEPQSWVYRRLQSCGQDGGGPLKSVSKRLY